jgi:hypothetical protein
MGLNDSRSFMHCNEIYLKTGIKIGLRFTQNREIV